MTENQKLKRELIYCIIGKLQHWVNTSICFTEKVTVKVEQTGNDTVDDVSLVFTQPFENRPGADTVFLALHYKDSDTTLPGDHYRFHHANYGMFTETDTWVKAPSVTEGESIIAHHALLGVINVLHEFLRVDPKVLNHFEPGDAIFPYSLILSEKEYKQFKVLFE